MGAGTSAEEAEAHVNALPHAVTRLSSMLTWRGDVQGFIDAAFDDEGETISKTKGQSLLIREGGS